MTAEYELHFLEACIPLLKDYLLSKELDWPAGVSAKANLPPYPRLTIGNFLLFLQRLRGKQMKGKITSEQELRLDQLEQDLDAQRDRWRSHWYQKAERELGYRLRMWGNYLEDYRDNPSGNVDRFAYEIRLRVMIELLLPECGQVSTSEKDMLVGLDRILRNVLVAGEFIWDEEIQPGFPPDIYWFLYGSLKKYDER